MENPITRQVGERVAQIRAEMEMTQAALAERMSAFLGREVRPLTITRLEGGKRPIGVDELVAAASAMQVKPADLLADSDLPMGAVDALAAGQSLVRATNEVHRAIREWTHASMNLRMRLRRKGSERLSAPSRLWLESIARLSLDDVVKAAAATLAAWAADLAAGNDADTRYASVPVPPGATAHGWDERCDGSGWERVMEWPCDIETNVEGTAVGIEGSQNAAGGTFTRRVHLWGGEPVELTAAQAQQLASALAQAADVLDELDNGPAVQR